MKFSDLRPLATLSAYVLALVTLAMSAFSEGEERTYLVVVAVQLTLLATTSEERKR